MYFKAKIVTFLLCVSLCLSKKSFSIVLDTTLSMREEIDVIKTNIGAVFNSVDLTDVESFVLVPFKDPDVGPLQTFSSSSELVSNLNNLSVSGGQECPENALAAIQTALEASKPESQIFVFTDAYAKDNSKLAEVQNLCMNTRSQVIIILSGSCVPTQNRQGGGIDVYYDVARFCKGGILQFELGNLKQAFTVMKEIMKIDWSEVKTHDITSYNSDIQLSVDPATTNLMMTVYGNCRLLQVYDNGGSAVNVNKIIHTPNVLVVRFSELNPGNYSASFSCQGRTSTTVYKRNDLPIQIGFSVKQTNSLKLTSPRPMPGWENYILLVLPPTSSIKLTSLKIYNINTNETKTYDLKEDSEYKGHYSTYGADEQIALYYFDHDTFFQITVSGYDTANNLDVTKITKILETQKALWSPGVNEVQETKPRVEIIMDNHNALVDYDSTVTIACKITGYPDPEIFWQNGNYESLPANNFTVEIPNVFGSFATIEKIKNNVTVQCNAKNSKGEDSQSLDLYVKRTFFFKEIRVPQDETIEYGAEVRLYCEIEAYPEATTSWYHNDTLMNSYFLQPNIEIVSQNKELLIKNMTLEDAGIYRCEVKNDFDTRKYSAKMEISGLETPRVELDKTEINLKPGDRTEIDCVAKGKPTPDISWKYRRDGEVYFTTIPEEVNSEAGKITITSAKMEHSGVYRCEASNVLGSDYQDVTVKIQYAPTVKVNTETLTVNEGDMVELTCEVEAIPAATVRWEMIKDGATMPFEDRHTVDDHHTLRFQAMAMDSRDYQCIAENQIGRAEKTVKVNVNVEVYIQAPQHKTITLRAGSSITLQCNIMYGYPTPSIIWEFVSSSSTSILFRGNTPINDLRLTNISKDNEGSYICIANNGVTSDNIKIDLKVQ